VQPPTRATESGNWRSAKAAQEQQGGGRGGYPSRGSRGGAAPRGARNEGRDSGRPPRGNGVAPAAPAAQPAAEAEAAPKTDEDGWTTVTVPSKGRRGGRPMMS
jgi:translation initiation factor 4B